MSSFLERLRSGSAAQFGTWVKIPAIETVEILAQAGFDYVVIDMEHSPLTLESAYRAIVVAQGKGMAALVRVPDHSGIDAQRLLDAGADGILVPRVNTLEEATLAIGRMVFSPRGQRGMGLTSRAGGWGIEPMARYLARGDEEVLLCMQLEDLSALKDVRRILNLENLGALFIGFGDLTMSTGRPATDPEIEGLVDSVLNAASERGLPVGTAVANAEAARRAAARGYGFVMVSNDASLFARAARQLVEESTTRPAQV